MKMTLRNIHPGEVLQEEFLEPMHVTAYALAKAIGVPQTRVSQIVRGKRSVTADTALLLGRFFGTTPKFWLGLQEDFDLEEQGKALRSRLAAIRPHKAVVSRAAV